MRIHRIIKTLFRGLIFVLYVESLRDGYQKQISDLEARMTDRQTDIEAKLQEIKAEQCILTSSMLAVLDGLQQLHCNGNVTKAHSELEQYLNEQAHH